MKRHLALLLGLALLMGLCACAKPHQPTDEEVLQAYQLATEPASWFRISTLPTDPADTKEHLGDFSYAKVISFTSRNQLREHLLTLFDQELSDILLDGSDYIDIDGALYTLDAARGTDPAKGEESYAVVRERDDKIVLEVTVELLGGENFTEVVGGEVYDFPFEWVENRWVFTSFPEIR